MKIKEVFEQAEDGTLTYEQFQKIVKEANANFTDLAEGKYVSKGKYDDELASLQEQIETLNGTIGTRDTDLEALKKQLEEAGTDAEKLTTLSNDFTALQGKYDADVKAYKEQLKRQAYEFAVKDFANKQKFTSNAAKRDFVQSMLAKGLKMDGDSILGAEDFRAAYSADNADAFVVDNPEPEYDYAPEPARPMFVESTPSMDVGRKLSLSEQMQMKNENPNFVVSF